MMDCAVSRKSFKDGSAADQPWKSADDYALAGTK